MLSLGMKRRRRRGCCWSWSWPLWLGLAEGIFQYRRRLPTRLASNPVAIDHSTALPVENAGDDGVGVNAAPAAAAPPCPRRCAPSPAASDSARRPSSAGRVAPPPCRGRNGGWSPRSACAATPWSRAFFVVGACQTLARSAPRESSFPPLRGRQPTQTLRLAPHQFGLGRLPARRASFHCCSFAGDQAIVGIDGAMTPLGAVNGELRPLDIEPPLLSAAPRSFSSRSAAESVAARRAGSSAAGKAATTSLSIACIEE